MPKKPIVEYSSVPWRYQRICLTLSIASPVEAYLLDYIGDFGSGEGEVLEGASKAPLGGGVDWRTIIKDLCPRVNESRTRL